ncbi:MAG: restriction endonuclease subunit S [Saprospiraceae bacterium]
MDWKEIKIKDLGEILTGNTPPTTQRKFYGDEYTFIKPTDMVSDQRYVYETGERFSELGYKRFKKYLLPIDTTVVVTIGTIGKLCLTREPSFTNQATNAIVVDENEFDKKFIYYLMVYNNPKVKNLSSGTASGRENVSKGVFESIKVNVPSLESQKKIAHILSTYDDLIENNQKRIAILEQMAQNIYKEWFVRFRFPGWEEVVFVDDLPEGWRVEQLGNFIEIKKGKNITRNTITEGKVPVIAGGLNPAYFHNEANTISPTITISASGANAGFVNLYYENIWASDCSYIDSEMTTFLYYVFLTLKVRQKEVYNLQKGSAQPHVYPKDLMRLNIDLPSISIVEKFEKLITPIFEQIKALTTKNEILQQTRNRLLPRLLSGQLKV